MINLSLLKTFLTLADCGSFSEAAKLLGSSQPTVSQQVARLEAELNITLLERNRNGCVLTPEGERAVSHARALIRSALRFPSSIREDLIDIGCSGNIASYFISDTLRAFKDASNDRFKWSIINDANPNLAERLETGELDIAAMEWPDLRPTFTTFEWRQEPLILIVGPDHSLSDQATIDIDDMLKMPFIGGENGSGTGSMLKDALGERVHELQVSMNVGSTEAVKDAVKAGLGVSIVLSRAVEMEVQLGKLVAIPVNGVVFKKTFYVAVRADTPLSSAPMKLARFMATGAYDEAA